MVVSITRSVVCSSYQPSSKWFNQFTIAPAEPSARPVLVGSGMERVVSANAGERDPVERPEQGVRLLARMVEHDVEAATYAIALATHDAAWEARACVRDSDGAVDVSAWTPEAPPTWLAQGTHALLRSAWQRRRSGHPWPRRLARWRPSPDEAEG